KNSEIYNWGKNAGLMLGRPADNVLYNPAVPDGVTIGTDQILAVETGGHTTMLVKKCESNFGYVGHAVSGSMANDQEKNFYEFTYNTAAVQICGARSTPEINIISPSITTTVGIDEQICMGS